MWLTGRLAPDFKTIADFRHDNGAGIRNVCRRFVILCRDLKLFSQGAVAIDSSKFKAVNSRDRNFTPAKIDKRKEQIEQSIQRYMAALDTADRTLPLPEFGPRYAQLTTTELRALDAQPLRRKASQSPWHGASLMRARAGSSSCSHTPSAGTGSTRRSR
jgi:hypothetical protein